jgi:PQQ enzyme repeat
VYWRLIGRRFNICPGCGLRAKGHKAGWLVIRIDTRAVEHGKTVAEILKHERMKPLFSILSVILVCFWSGVVSTNAQVNVTQFHNHDSRDGLYVDSAFTPGAAANLMRDLNFDGTIVGNVYAQPLYIENGPGGRAMIIAVTESNNVYALDALDGSIIWQRNVGDPVDADDLICTKFDPMGIIGTPIVDLASRALFLDAMITPDGGATKKHLIFSLNVDTGDINAGWPVDVEATVSYNGRTFNAAIQQQRPALGIVGNILYVGYGSMADCSMYRGWLVGVPIDNPASVTAWAAATDTGIWGGAIWGVGGVASDGKNPFVTTGNTFNTGGDWSGGEAVIRFQPGPVFSGDPSDYWVPTNWLDLDNIDWDLGGSGALLVDVPGATPSHLVVALGKDGKAYLVDRDNLGGVSAPVASSQVASASIIQAAATYRTLQGTYVAFRANGPFLKTFRITATTPPGITNAWSINRGSDGCGSPFATSTDGTNDIVVWVVGTQPTRGTGGDQRLHGYDGNTGAVVYDGGGPNELMAGTHNYSTTGIAARGRIYIAGDNKVYAFVAPVPTPTPTPTPSPTPRATPTPRPRPTPLPRPTPR